MTERVQDILDILAELLFFGHELPQIEEKTEICIVFIVFIILRIKENFVFVFDFLEDIINEEIFGDVFLG